MQSQLVRLFVYSRYLLQVSKHDATAVQRQLEGELFGKWEESFTTMEAKGIRTKELPKFLDHMVGTYEGINLKHFNAQILF